MNFRGALIIKKEEWYAATCLENNIASQGKTIDGAIENLKEAIELYYEDEIRDDVGFIPQEQFFITTAGH